MRGPIATLFLVASACGGAPASNPDGSAGGDGDVPADAAPTSATIRVHYPLGSHALAIRGSGAGLNWDAGAPATVSGDVATYELAHLSAPIEWKPLLDDTMWARGPNYHVAPGASLDVYPHFTQITGHVVTQIAAFHSATLGNDRSIYVYLPASYAENTVATYPVVYMHDGQNLWAAMPQLSTFGATWNVDTAFDAAAEHGACSSATVDGWGAQPLGGTATTCIGDADCGTGGACVTFPEAIVVGVANGGGDRIYEYTPTTDPGTAGGGGADLYLTMLISELKPTIDVQLRTRHDANSTVLMGSSLGGLVTAYAGLHHTDVFSRLGELSPSTWWNNEIILDDINAAGVAASAPAVIYVDSGAGTVDGQAETDQLVQTYLSHGYTVGARFRHVVQQGAAHSEVYWAQRLPGALQLLLGAR